MNKVKYFFKVLITPSCWIQQNPFNATYDDWLRKQLLKKKCFGTIFNYEAVIDGRCIWIENHPYASFVFCRVRPRRKTILWAHDKMIEELLARQKL